MAASTAGEDTIPPDTKRRELLAFLFLTVVLAPILAVAFVGGWGLIVWLLQHVYGPPGPPAGLS